MQPLPFQIGVTFAFFHRLGKVLEFRLWLKIEQMLGVIAYARALTIDPGMPSCPIAVLALVPFRARSTSEFDIFLNEKQSTASQPLKDSIGASVGK